MVRELTASMGELHQRISHDAMNRRNPFILINHHPRGSPMNHDPHYRNLHSLMLGGR